MLPDCGLLLRDLEYSLGNNFLPALFASAECNLFSLPLQMGRLGVKNPVTTASYCHASSICSTTSLVKFTVGHSPFELDTHIDTVCSSKDYDQASLSKQIAVTFKHLVPHLDCPQHILSYMPRIQCFRVVVCTTT